MSINKIILETLGMMGFTFIVGMSVAYIIKFLVEIFHFFRKGNISAVFRDYKAKLVYEQKRRENIKKLMSLMEENSEVGLLRYLYENKNKYDVEEEVDDLYNLFKFYRGIYKDKKENDGINELIKYYNGEV